MQKIQIEVSHQDQVYVEEECTKLGHSLSSFFILLLDQYREPKKEVPKQVHQESVNDPVEEVNSLDEEVKEKPKKTRKRKSQ